MWSSRFRHAARSWPTVVVASLIAIGMAAPAAAAPAPARLLHGGVQGNALSVDAAISADGGSVVFISEASNLVPGDTNDAVDVFVRDLRCGVTRRVSLSSAGEQAAGPTDPGPLLLGGTQVSADGRFAVFASRAPNLVPGDTNRSMDLFVRDSWRGTTRRVNVGASGEQADSDVYAFAMNPTGRFVAFLTPSALVPEDTNGLFDVFLRDLWAGTTRRVSVGATGQQATGGQASSHAISGDGRYVAFGSEASNLVPNDTNGASDVFIRDTWRGTTRRITVGRSGEQGNGDGTGGLALTPDGRFVVFTSAASNLVPGDTNRLGDVFVRDLRSGITERINVGTEGQQANRLTYGRLSISADGHLVSFASAATNLVPAPNAPFDDVYLRDRRRGTTERLAVTPTGEPGNGFSSSDGATVLSPDGRFATFASDSSNLVPGDTNDTTDVFLRDLHRRTTQRISLGNPG